MFLDENLLENTYFTEKREYFSVRVGKKYIRKLLFMFGGEFIMARKAFFILMKAPFLGFYIYHYLLVASCATFFFGWIARMCVTIAGLRV